MREMATPSLGGGRKGDALSRADEVKELSSRRKKESAPWKKKNTAAAAGGRRKETKLRRRKEGVTAKEGRTTAERGEGVQEWPF